jgi:hypothetical protein
MARVRSRHASAAGGYGSRGGGGGHNGVPAAVAAQLEVLSEGVKRNSGLQLQMEAMSHQYRQVNEQLAGLTAAMQQLTQQLAKQQGGQGEAAAAAVGAGASRQQGGQGEAAAGSGSGAGARVGVGASRQQGGLGEAASGSGAAEGPTAVGVGASQQQPGQIVSFLGDWFGRELNRSQIVVGFSGLCLGVGLGVLLNRRSL